MRSERYLQVEQPDAVLVEAARADDRRAFRLLIRRHSPRLRQRLSAWLRSPALIDDLSQEACLKAWQGLRELKKPASFGPWLCGIGVHVMLKWYRRSRTDVLGNAESLDADGAAEAVDAGRTPYSELEQRAVHDRLYRAIRALPERYCEVLTLYYEDELPCDEIARRIPISIAAVHQRLVRGREILSKEMASSMAALGPLGAAGMPVRSPDAFVEAVMRAVRKKPRPRTSPGRVGRAVGTAGAQVGWRLVPGMIAALLGLLTPAMGGVLWVAHAVRDAIAAMSPDDLSPGRSWSSDAPAGLPAGPWLPSEPPDEPGEPAATSQLVDDDAPDPDYIVHSESTHAESAIFGAHELRPMDAYGKQLYELVSKAFVMHFALCLRSDVVGLEDRSRIEVDLRFWLWPDRERVTRIHGDAPIADERDVTYQLAGLRLSKIQKFQFSRCLQDAFDNTGFPEPGDGAPRSIQHYIVVDFGIIARTLDAMCAATP